MALHCICWLRERLHVACVPRHFSPVVSSPTSFNVVHGAARQLAIITVKYTYLNIYRSIDGVH